MRVGSCLVDHAAVLAVAGMVMVQHQWGRRVALLKQCAQIQHDTETCSPTRSTDPGTATWFRFRMPLHFRTLFICVRAVYITANVSGGHINPAVTLSTILTGHINLTKGLCYIVAQIGGACIGTLLMVSVGRSCCSATTVRVACC